MLTLPVCEGVFWAVAGQPLQKKQNPTAHADITSSKLTDIVTIVGRLIPSSQPTSFARNRKNT